MATFVLVHGGWHGAWCWRKVVPLVERLGHAAIAPDLPGHGDDLTPIAELDMRAYAARVVAAIDAAGEPVVLVGHSLGGMVISAAAESRPERVRRLVYLAAFLPRDGQSLADLARADTGSLLGTISVVAADGATIGLREEGLAEAFYADCRDDDLALARRRLRPEPRAPLAEPVALTAARFGAIPRAYIECRDDRAVSPGAQRLMQSAQPCDPVATLPSGHSPFFSMPERLVGYLVDIPRQDA